MRFKGWCVRFLAGAVVAVLLAAGAAVFAPAEVSAATVRAGNKDDFICTCPVTVGDCICRYGT